MTEDTNSQAPDTEQETAAPTTDPALPGMEELVDNPKVTEEDVLNAIVEVKTETVTLVGKPHTITAVRLRNGFTVVETSTAVDINNYDKEIGEQVNLDRIKRKVWLLLGFQLQSKLDDCSDVCKSEVLRELRELISSAKGEDSLSEDEIDNAVSLIDAVLDEGEDSYKQRARIELRELTGRIDRLKVFMDREAFDKLSPMEQDRLRSQLKAMQSYATVLNSRVSNFNAG